jgi:putative phage-type endonuclease
VPITEVQRVRRRRFIGSSDLAALFGLDPYKDAYEVWLNKTGQLNDQPPNEAMLLGLLMERQVLEWASRQLGPMRVNQYRHRPGSPIAANIDAIVWREQVPVEAKVSGILGPLREEWGEPGSDEVPKRVILQCHAHMISLLNRPNVCHVAALLGGRGMVLFHVPFEQDIADAIITRASEFWQNNVVAKTPPPSRIPSSDILARIKRVPNKVVKVHERIAYNYLAAEKLAKQVAEMAAGYKSDLIAALGDAEAADCGRLGQFTYFRQTRKSIDTGRLRKEHPEIAAEYTKESTFPVLKRVAPKDAELPKLPEGESNAE